MAAIEQRHRRQLILPDGWRFCFARSSGRTHDRWLATHLALSRGPLFGLVARLVHQKGVDLVLDAAETIVAAGGQIVVMGRGDPHFEDALRRAQASRPESIAVAICFQDAEARQIFAGNDFILMPSRFEPCGLSQMYAQRFGSLPIGHKTGGLADTIDDGRTGFLFE